MARHEYQRKNVIARVYSIKNGMKELQHVRLIRIICRFWGRLKGI